MKKVEKYAVLYLALNGKTAEEISKELKFPVKSVAKVIADMVEEVKEAVVDTPVVPRNPRAKFQHTTQSGKQGGVAIMTPQASDIGDMVLKAMPRQSDIDKSDHIFRPKPKA